MNLAQKASYWSRWQRAAACLAKSGLSREQIEMRRRSVTEKALGYAKSMSAWRTWRNAEVDKVFAAFAAIYDDGNLDAQLKAIEQPDERRMRVSHECTMLARDILDQRNTMNQQGEDSLNHYLNTTARNVCHKPIDACDDVELQRVKGALVAQVRRLEKAHQVEAAKSVDADEPF